MKVASLLACNLLLVPAFGVERDGRPVRNSFVDRKVSNTRQLLAHVAADPVVADRYERHFAMDRAGVLRLLGGLHRGTLAKTGRYTIYSVPVGGSLKMHVGQIRKGEPMFLDRSGRPILVVKCGNPVVLGPARSRKGNPATATLQVPGSGRALDLPSEGALASEEVLTLLPPIPAVPPSVPSLGDATEPEDVAAVAALGTGSGSRFSLLTLLPAVGGLAIPVGHSSGGQAVPEPLSVVCVAIGLGAVLRRRRS